MAKAGSRVKVTLRCAECKQRNYNTMKNKKNTTEKLERDMKSELKKVVWPTPKQTANNTAVCLVVMVVSALVLWGFDSLADQGVQLLLKLGGG